MVASNVMHKINQEALQDLMTSTKCHQCKTVFSEPIVSAPGQFSQEAIDHVNSTHGISKETYVQWLYGYLYNIERTPFGLKKS
jgi:hypothetical protein